MKKTVTVIVPDHETATSRELLITGAGDWFTDEQNNLTVVDDQQGKVASFARQEWTAVLNGVPGPAIALLVADIPGGWHPRVLPSMLEACAEIVRDSAEHTIIEPDILRWIADAIREQHPVDTDGATPTKES